MPAQMGLAKRLACVFLLAAGTFRQAAANQPDKPVNWDGPYAACNDSAELQKKTPMALRLRLETADTRLAEQAKRAMDFFAKILDMTWQVDNTDGCSLVVLDGQPELFAPASPGLRSNFAVSHVTDWDKFKGWIAVDDRRVRYFSDDDLFAQMAHEIFHLLGGEGHSEDPTSLMRVENRNIHPALYLYPANLAKLAARHAMKPGVDLNKPVFVVPAVEKNTWPIEVYTAQ